MIAIQEEQVNRSVFDAASRAYGVLDAVGIVLNADGEGKTVNEFRREVVDALMKRSEELKEEKNGKA